MKTDKISSFSDLPLQGTTNIIQTEIATKLTSFAPS